MVHYWFSFFSFSILAASMLSVYEICCWRLVLQTQVFYWQKNTRVIMCNVIDRLRTRAKTLLLQFFHTFSQKLKLKWPRFELIQGQTLLMAPKIHNKSSVFISLS